MINRIDRWLEFLYGILMVLGCFFAISAFSIGIVLLATTTHECHDEIAVPGYACDGGAKLVIEEKIAICRCGEANK